MKRQRKKNSKAWNQSSARSVNVLVLTALSQLDSRTSYNPSVISHCYEKEQERAHPSGVLRWNIETNKENDGKDGFRYGTGKTARVVTHKPRAAHCDKLWKGFNTIPVVTNLLDLIIRSTNELTRITQWILHRNYRVKTSTYRFQYLSERKKEIACDAWFQFIVPWLILDKLPLNGLQC